MVSRAAMRELCHLGMDLEDVLEILEQGENSPRRRRSGTIERRLFRNCLIKEAVLVIDYHHVLKEEVWVLTHVGTFHQR